MWPAGYFPKYYKAGVYWPPVPASAAGGGASGAAIPPHPPTDYLGRAFQDELELEDIMLLLAAAENYRLRRG